MTVREHTQLVTYEYDPGAWSLRRRTVICAVDGMSWPCPVERARQILAQLDVPAAAERDRVAVS